MRYKRFILRNTIISLKRFRLRYKINKNRKNYKYKIKLAVMNDFSEGTKLNNLKELCIVIKLR